MSIHCLRGGSFKYQFNLFIAKELITPYTAVPFDQTAQSKVSQWGLHTHQTDFMDLAEFRLKPSLWLEKL